MKLYTKKGDLGETDLYDLSRVSKASYQIEVFGLLDESLARLCHCIVDVEDVNIKTELQSIAAQYIAIMGSLAKGPISITMIDVLYLEQLIDAHTIKLPRLTQFILPYQTHQGAQLNLWRTSIRTCERLLVASSQEMLIDSVYLAYFNRLSDYAFTLTRLYESKVIL